MFLDSIRSDSEDASEEWAFGHIYAIKSVENWVVDKIVELGQRIEGDGLLEALYPTSHAAAESRGRVTGWREAIEALRDHIEANYHPASIDGARLRKIVAELESLGDVPKE